MPSTHRKSPEGFGEISKLPSGNYRARYTVDGIRHSAGTTFKTKKSAREFLATISVAVSAGTYEAIETIKARVAAEKAEAERKQISLGDYSGRWLRTRRNSKGLPLRPRTMEERERLLRPKGKNGESDPGGPLAELVPLLLVDISAELVREWYASQQERGTITQTARAYELLKAIMTTALSDKLIVEQPCTIRGGSTASTGVEISPPENEEQFERLLDATPDCYKALLVIAGATGCRYGEATNLRADDIIVSGNEVDGTTRVLVRINSGVVQVRGKYIEGAPKSLSREVLVSGIDADIIASHIKGKIGRERLFTAATSDGPLPQSTFWRHLNRARMLAGLPNIRFHDLRHYAGTRYARAGATLMETMIRLGHSTPGAALRYQHSADELRLEQLAIAAERKRPGVGTN